VFVSDLIGTWKPKKKKKGRKQFMWMGIPYAVVQSGTGEDTIGAGAGITGGMDGGGLGEGVDDWEPEDDSSPWALEFWVQPKDGHRWPKNMGEIMLMLDHAFGRGQWSISFFDGGGTSKQKIYLKKDAEKNFKVLTQAGLKVLFMEAAPVTIPKGVAALPEKIILEDGFYLERSEVKPIRAIYRLKRMLDDSFDNQIYITISKRGAKPTYMLQAHGNMLRSLTWDQRSRKGTYDEVNPFDKASIRKFMIEVLQAAGLL